MCALVTVVQTCALPICFLHLPLQQQIARRIRQPHGQAVEFLGDDDLAAEPRCLPQTEDEVEHVGFILARRNEFAVPLRFDDDMAGRASHRTLAGALDIDVVAVRDPQHRSEEHTSELQSLMRISYAVLCLKKKNQTTLP